MPSAPRPITRRRDTRFDERKRGRGTQAGCQICLLPHQPCTSGRESGSTYPNCSPKRICLPDRELKAYTTSLRQGRGYRYSSATFSCYPNTRGHPPILDSAAEVYSLGGANRSVLKSLDESTFRKVVQSGHRSSAAHADTLLDFSPSLNIHVVHPSFLSAGIITKSSRHTTKSEDGTVNEHHSPNPMTADNDCHSLTTLCSNKVNRPTSPGHESLSHIRVAKGIRHHFPLRTTEWMSYLRRKQSKHQKPRQHRLRRFPHFHLNSQSDHQ